MFSPAGRQSFGDILDRQKGFGSGFDVLRWVLALVIFYVHCKWLAGTSAVALPVEGGEVLAGRGWSGPKRPFQVALVPMFFALSGFLVTASALRVREVGAFLTLRALRIFPALTVEVALSALVLGPALTVLALGDYFTDWGFYRYFGNIFGFVSYHLPGVFTQNPATDIVNATLWTLPGEFYCYLITAGLMASGLMFDRAKFTTLYAAATVGLIVASLGFGFGLTSTLASTPLLVYYFFTGCLFFHWRHAIPRDAALLAVAAAAGYGLLYFEATAFLAPVFVVYGTVFFGLLHHDKAAGLRHFDYSYGIYLYGFPITQATLVLAPSLHGHGVLLFGVAGGVTLLFAAMSWHFIEQPMLGLKKRLTAQRRTTEPAPAVVPAKAG